MLPLLSKIQLLEARQQPTESSATPESRMLLTRGELDLDAPAADTSTLLQLRICREFVAGDMDLSYLHMAQILNHFQIRGIGKPDIQFDEAALSRGEQDHVSMVPCQPEKQRSFIRQWLIGLRQRLQQITSDDVGVQWVPAFADPDIRTRALSILESV